METTMAYTRQQNGEAERISCTPIETATNFASNNLCVSIYCE